MKTNLLQKYRYSIILLKELVITGFKLRYQGSVLGYMWSLLKPLFLFAILYYVFVYFLKIGEGVPHWPVSMLLGIVLWNFFAEVTNTGLAAIVDRGDVIRKINFPKYVIILSSSILALINLFFNFVVIALFMILNGVNLEWTALLAPLPIIELFALALGISFILSAVFVKLRDMNYIWEIIMQALFYGSAVLYPISMVLDRNEFLAKLLLLNPIAQSIQDARHLLIGDSNLTLLSLTGNVWLMIIPISIVVVTLVCGSIYFKRRSLYFAEDV